MQLIAKTRPWRNFMAWTPLQSDRWPSSSRSLKLYEIIGHEINPLSQLRLVCTINTIQYLKVVAGMYVVFRVKAYINSWVRDPRNIPMIEAYTRKSRILTSNNLWLISWFRLVDKLLGALGIWKIKTIELNLKFSI